MLGVQLQTLCLFIQQVNERLNEWKDESLEYRGKIVFLSSDIVFK